MAEGERANAQQQGSDLVGQTLDRRYVVEKIIGQGGFGTVYSATHAHTRDRLAIKVLRATVASDPTVVERFRREATLTSQLKHPNTVSVIDFGEMDDGRLYLVMPFLEGRTLTDMLREEGPVSAERLLPIAVQVLKSLDEAHSKGMVHRDLKPDNIFLQDLHGEADFVRVLDFGIARSLDSKEQDLTTAGTVMGTPKYMSPEQATGKKADARADLYALGVILFEALSGITPLLGETPLATIFRRATEDAPKVDERLLLPTPQGICDAVLKAMSRDPANRFATAAEMTQALEKGLSTPIQLPRRAADPPPPPPKPAATLQYPAKDNPSQVSDDKHPPPPPPSKAGSKRSPRLRKKRSLETKLGNPPGVPVPPSSPPPPPDRKPRRTVNPPSATPPSVTPPPKPAPPSTVAASSASAPKASPKPAARAARPASAASHPPAAPVAKKSSSKAPLIAAVVLLLALAAGAAAYVLQGDDSAEGPVAAGSEASDTPKTADEGTAKPDDSAAKTGVNETEQGAASAGAETAAQEETGAPAAPSGDDSGAAAGGAATGKPEGSPEPAAAAEGDEQPTKEPGAADDETAAQAAAAEAAEAAAAEAAEAAAAAEAQPEEKAAAAEAQPAKKTADTSAKKAAKKKKKKRRKKRRRPIYRPGSGGVGRPGR